MKKNSSKVPAFAFIVHARDWSDAGRRVAAVTGVDEKICIKVFSFLPLRFIIGTVFLLLPLILPRTSFTVCTPRGFDVQGKARGYILAVFLSAWQMKTMMRWNWTRRWAYEYIARAVIYAQKKYGIKRVGLGAISAPLAKGGQWLVDDSRITARVTHGDTLTGAFVTDIIQEACRLFGCRNISEKTVAVVGASGLVGSVATRLIARIHRPKKMILTANRNMSRLEEIETLLRREDGYKGEIVVTLDTAEIVEADIAVLTTTAPGDIVSADILKDGVIVIDMAQPINMSRRVLEECQAKGKTVHRVDGGFITIPNVDLRFPLGPPRGTTFACLVETMVETMAGMDGDYVGIVDDMDFAQELLRVAKSYGFRLSPLTNFSEPVGK